MSAECSILYDRSVRAEIRKLRGASDKQLLMFNKDSIQKRRHWFEEEHLEIKGVGANPLLKAYQVLLRSLVSKKMKLLLSGEMTRR